MKAFGIFVVIALVAILAVMLIVPALALALLPQTGKDDCQGGGSGPTQTGGSKPNPKGKIVEDKSVGIEWQKKVKDEISKKQVINGVPKSLVPIYQASASYHKLEPGPNGVSGASVLAGINAVETEFGTNLNISTADARGWMQFIPESWKAFGMDGNGDGLRNPYDPWDAIFAAGAHLKGPGKAPQNWRAGIFSYNHADWYVNMVLERAKKFNIPASGGGGGGEEEKCDDKKDQGGGASGDAASLAKQLLEFEKQKKISFMLWPDENIKAEMQSLADKGCSPNSSGRCVKVDAGLMKTLVEAAQSKGGFSINSFTGGHSSFAESSHNYGKAVDVAPEATWIATIAKKNGATHSGAACGGSAGLPSVEGGDSHCHLGWGKAGFGP